jgi:hypothetical protein
MCAMPSCHCVATDRHFTPARAQAELAQYRQRGPRGTARLILRTLNDLAAVPGTHLDIGAGVGVLHHELLGSGVGRAVHVEASAAYVAAAEQESARRGHGGRVQFRHGDCAPGYSQPLENARVLVGIDVDGAPSAVMECRVKDTRFDRQGSHSG